MFQISYELGEIHLGLIDMRSDMIRQKSTTGVLDPRLVKRSDLIKFNELCRHGLMSLYHFTHFFSSKNEKEKLTKKFLSTELTLIDLITGDYSCTEYDEGEGTVIN